MGESIRKEMRVEPNDLLDESIRADNACLDAARRPGMTLGCIFAAATTAATGMPKAVMTRLPTSSLAASR